MKITVIGAGAMGSLYGGYLSTKHDVLLVDTDKSKVEALNQTGLVITEPDGSIKAYPINAASETKNIEAQDLVIIFVKALFTESALKSNLSLFGPETYVLSLQNGAGHQDVLMKYVNKDHVIIGTTQHNAAFLSPGAIRHGGQGITCIGNLAGETESLEKFKNAFEECGFPVELSDNIGKLIWHKLFTNVTLSALTGVLQVPMGYITQDTNSWAMAKTLLKEAVAVAKADGHEFDEALLLEEIEAVSKKSPDGQTSIFADLRDGRRTEVDTISGFIVKTAEQKGVSAPSHAFLVNMVHAMENKNKN
jgi:2-dehydropantoate 2-reductase